jgi:hypothetical protein
MCGDAVKTKDVMNDRGREKVRGEEFEMELDLSWAPRKRGLGAGAVDRGAPATVVFDTGQELGYTPRVENNRFPL